MRLKAVLPTQNPLLVGCVAGCGFGSSANSSSGKNSKIIVETSAGAMVNHCYL